MSGRDEENDDRWPGRFRVQASATVRRKARAGRRDCLRLSLTWTLIIFRRRRGLTVPARPNAMRASPMTSPEPSEPTVPFASLLGTKGALRIRHHISSARPHIVLKRVIISEDGSDEEEDANSSVVYFSFFAAKRIEVKPGKELLFAVDTDDKEFKDRVLMIQGSLAPEPPSADEVVEEAAPPEEKEEEAVALPPKLRRTWVRPPEEQVIPPRT